MEIIKNLVSPDRYAIKCPHEMAADCIVVHNTANDATARNEIAYMLRNDNKVSFHYAVDDKEIVQGIPENRNSWNAGDGGKGVGNRKGIAVEICYSKSGGEKFVAAEKLAAKFIASKLVEKGWSIEKVKKHQDFSGKYCPHRTLDMGWERFLAMVKSEMGKDFGTCSLKISVLKKGSKGQPVKVLQNLLICFGYSCGSCGADGSFGSATEQALRAYQKDRGLSVDGSCGPATWRALLGVTQ